MGLKVPTDEDKKKHVNAIMAIRADGKISQEGFKSGYISKAQMKKAVADAYNREQQYIKDNDLFILFGNIYIEEEDQEAVNETEH